MSSKAKPILTKQDAAQQFIKKLEALDYSRSTGEKFRDLIELAYCSFAKLTAPTKERADELEARYMRIVNGYKDKDTVRAYPELVGIAWEQVRDFGYDFLGEVAGQLGALSADQGQFFTPFQVSEMMARMLLGDVHPLIESDGYITVHEPAAGAGGMVLACANVLQSEGFDPALTMLVHAVDISQFAYHMSYLQLTWRGVSAYVERSNSLSLEHFEGAWTVNALAFEEHHGHLSFQKRQMPIVSQSEVEFKPSVSAHSLVQLRLWD